MGAVQYLHLEYGIPLSDDAFASAAASGSIPLACWLLKRGCPVPEWAFSGAIAAGHVHMVRWLAQEAGCKPSWQDLDNLLNLWPFLPGGRQHSGDCVQAARVILAGLSGWREPLGEEVCGAEPVRGGGMRGGCGGAGGGSACGV